MKKVIIGLSALVIISFVVLLFVNAKSSTLEVRKTSTEVLANCAKCPSAAECSKMDKTKTAVCDPAKCKEMGCDQATCKAMGAGAKCEMKNNEASNCATACPMMKALR